MKNPIVRSNEWYDNLPEPKRGIFFLLAIFGTFVITQILAYVLDLWYFLPIWMIIVSFWRVSYIFILARNDYKKRYGKN